jgi:hypothetical protein
LSLWWLKVRGQLLFKHLLKAYCEVTVGMNTDG